MIDKVAETVIPDPVVPIPVGLESGPVGQQRRGGDALRLDPEVLVLVMRLALQVVAVDQSAMLGIPAMLHRRVEQLPRAA